MITFDNEHYLKFLDASLTGTGYLAYRDIKKIINLYEVEIDKILDLGCASGRSTTFLKTLSNNVYACDISDFAINLIKQHVTKNAFVNDLHANQYIYSPYSAIFSFFTFFHLTNKEEVVTELLRCYCSLSSYGYLIIVVPCYNLFYRNYSSVECIEQKPEKDGDIVKLNLKKINSIVENCYWSYETLIQLATDQKFQLSGIHLPIGRKADEKEYIDEFHYAPYVYIVLRKDE